MSADIVVTLFVFVTVLQRQPCRKGDRVKITDNLAQLMSLQEGHGGWIPEMQCVSSRVQKNLGFLKKPNPVGFLGFIGFYWVLGFYWVFLDKQEK